MLFLIFIAICAAIVIPEIIFVYILPFVMLIVVGYLDAVKRKKTGKGFKWFDL